MGWGDNDPQLMKTLLTTMVFGGALALSSSGVFAGKDSNLGETFGKPTIADSFDKSKLGKKWVVAKGEWKVVGGAISGKELPADKHAAVLNFQQPNTDSAIQFSFKLDGAKGFNLSFNKARGHLFRVAVAGDGLTITLDKDKKDPKSRPQRLAKAGGKFEQGEWYTMLVVVEGPGVSVKTDNGLSVSASHSTLSQAKPNYRFVMRGASLQLDDVKVWPLK